MDNNQFSRAIIAVRTVLNDPEVKVSSNLVEDLSFFKEILSAISNGQLIVAAPDRLLPESIEPKKEIDTSDEET